MTPKHINKLQQVGDDHDSHVEQKDCCSRPFWNHGSFETLMKHTDSFPNFSLTLQIT